MKNMILFLRDDFLNIVYNKKVLEVKMQSIKKGFIDNRNLFREELMKLLKKEKIKNKLFGDDIYVVKNTYFKDADLFYIESLLLDLGFTKVIFWDIRKLFLRDDTTYIELNDSYMVINLESCVFVDLSLGVDIIRVLEFFVEDLEGTVVLFGSNKEIPNIKLKNKDLFYFDNYDNFVTESLLKVKKYDV